jgi:uncharacterized membrane protein (UPF0127 family)
VRNTLQIICVCLTLLLTQSASASEADLKKPQFEKKILRLGSVSLEVEIADTDDKRSYGLMNRAKMSDREGMLFVFGVERPVSFWMKNTLLPLNIGFFDAKKQLVDLQEMTVLSEMEINPPIYPSKKPAFYALEVNRGWFNKNHIKLGIEFELKEIEKDKEKHLKSAPAQKSSRK